MKILVTGANGFVAKNLIQFLAEKPEVEVLKLYRDSTAQELEQMVLDADWIVHITNVKKKKNNLK